MFDQELRDVHAEWLERKEREKQRDVPEAEECWREEEEDAMATEVPAEVETPIASAPQDLPITVDTGIPPSILHGIESPSDPFTNINRTAAASSPTLSISTVSDLTLTELGDDIGVDSSKWILTRHETFYLEDGNVEIVCGHTIFRVHSPVVSFSSRNLRDVLSPFTLLNAPMPEGCPRVVFKDSAEDFGVLLMMIYTPGYIPPYPRCRFYELTV